MMGATVAFWDTRIAGTNRAGIWLVLQGVSGGIPTHLELLILRVSSFVGSVGDQRRGLVIMAYDLSSIVYR